METTDLLDLGWFRSTAQRLPRRIATRLIGLSKTCGRSAASQKTAFCTNSSSGGTTDRKVFCKELGHCCENSASDFRTDIWNSDTEARHLSGKSGNCRSQQSQYSSVLIYYWPCWSFLQGSSLASLGLAWTGLSQGLFVYVNDLDEAQGGTFQIFRGCLPYLSTRQSNLSKRLKWWYTYIYMYIIYVYI